MKTSFRYLLLLLSFFTISINAIPVSLVWQHNREKAWEEDWLMELLDGVDVQVVDDGKYKKFIDNSIIVISSWQKFTNCRAYFKKLRKMNYKFGIILLSDERYLAPTDFYKYANFVFRNYWHKNFARQKKVSVFPLGYKTGYWKNGRPEIKEAVLRDFTWSFAGQIANKPTREAMIAQLKTFPHFHIHETFAWAYP